jgi:alkylhydroperoxidase family enzyme
MALNKFKKHCVATAPESSVKPLEDVKQAFGFIPNLIAYMAESPVLANGYVSLLNDLQNTDLSPLERQVVMMTANRFHECRYCMAGHTFSAEKDGLDMNVIYAIRDDKPLGDPKLAVLRAFTLNLVKNRGVISQTLLNAFFDAGYSQQNALEVIAVVALKVMSNFTNHMVGTEVDGIAMNKRWSPVTER